MKTFCLASVLAAWCCFAVSVRAGDEIICKSPDGQFALGLVGAGETPQGNVAIVETRTRKVAADLGPNDSDRSDTNLLWFADSQRVAYFVEQDRAGSTRVFFRRDAVFEEIKLPELPDPNHPTPTAPDLAHEEIVRRVEPSRWLKSGDLVLENELQHSSWGRVALEITIGFDQERRASIRKAEPQETSIIDYFVALPPRTFEDTALKMLRFIRKPSTVIDKKNGYIRCKGDGAQGDFEVALFRYRDRRPLVAVSTGSTEEEKGTYLQFFEARADGKMQKSADSLFPIPDVGRAEHGGPSGKWQFDLPRYGKTILVRNARSGKILHKITWNGERFREEK
jgi:hypothetical protein